MEDSQYDRIMKNIDKCIVELDAIFFLLAGKKLLTDIEKYHAVKEAEYIVAEDEPADGPFFTDDSKQL